MRVASLWIPGRMPGQNELGAMLRHKGGYRKYAAIKRKWQETIGLLLASSPIAPFEAAHVRFELVEPNKRRDPDNACAGAVKICLDALQQHGVLGNDGWTQVLSLSFKWRVDKAKPGVLVTLLAPGTAATRETD